MGTVPLDAVTTLPVNGSTAAITVAGLYLLLAKDAMYRSNSLFALANKELFPVVPFPALVLLKKVKETYEIILWPIC